MNPARNLEMNPARNPETNTERNPARNPAAQWKVEVDGDPPTSRRSAGPLNAAEQPLLSCCWPVNTHLQVRASSILTHIHSHTRCRLIPELTSPVPLPEPVWSVTVQYSVAFSLSPSHSHPSLSPPPRSFSSGLSCLPPASLCGSSAVGGTRLRPLQAEDRYHSGKAGFREDGGTWTSVSEVSETMSAFQANHGCGENILLPGEGPTGPRRRTIPPSYQTVGGHGLCALICFLRPLPVPLIQMLETGADETFAETLSTGEMLARLTWAPSAGLLLTGGLCRSSVWLEEEEETGPFTKPRRE